MDLDTDSVLAWRAQRQGLGRPLDLDAVGVAERVLAARAWPIEGAESAFGVRQTQPWPGSVAAALEAGVLVQSYAFRGGSYVFTPEIGAVLLAVRTTSKVWETRRWQGQIDAEISDWTPLREAVCERLAQGPATREEIAHHLRETRSLRYLAEAAASGAGADSLYKPLHWWGDIAFGPPRGRHSTFRLLRGDPHWSGLPEVDEAGRSAVRHYLRAYGPATWTNLHYWLAEGLSAPSRHLKAWLADLSEEVTEVDVDGVACHVLTTDLEELAATTPSPQVRLLPPFDPWVIGPGTADTRIVPKQHRRLLSTGSAPVLQGGRVTGTWRRDRDIVNLSWFDDATPASKTEVAEALARLSAALGANLSPA